MRDTGTGQQVAQFHERLMMMMMMIYHCLSAKELYTLTAVMFVMSFETQFKLILFI